MELIRQTYMYGSLFPEFADDVDALLSDDLTRAQLQARFYQLQLELEGLLALRGDLARIAQGLWALGNELPSHVEADLGIVGVVMDERSGLGVKVGCCRIGLKGISEYGASASWTSEPRARVALRLSLLEGCYGAACGHLWRWSHYIGSGTDDAWQSPDLGGSFGFFVETGASVTFYLGSP